MVVEKTYNATVAKWIQFETFFKVFIKGGDYADLRIHLRKM